MPIFQQSRSRLGEFVKKVVNILTCFGYKWIITKENVEIIIPHTKLILCNDINSSWYEWKSRNVITIHDLFRASN